MTIEPLPPILDRIAELIGRDAALTLALHRGGQRVYLPEHPRPGHWLVGLIGMEAAQTLCKHFSTTPLTIPQGPTGALAQIQRQMRRRRGEALARGLSANDVAAISGYSVRQVYRTRAARRLEIASGQADLFLPAPGHLPGDTSD